MAKLRIINRSSVGKRFKGTIAIGALVAGGIIGTPIVDELYTSVKEERAAIYGMAMEKKWIDKMQAPPAQ